MQNVITPSVGRVVGLVVARLLIDGLAWRVVATMLDYERAVAGNKT
jgi:hypothetical protein